MLSKNIRFKNFSAKTKNKKIYNIFNELKKNYLKKKKNILLSLSQDYTYSYNKHFQPNFLARVRIAQVNLRGKRYEADNSYRLSLQGRPGT